MAKKQKETIYLEALPKAVRRALRAPQAAGMLPLGFDEVEVHASDPRAGEHGKTTLSYSHSHDAATHSALQGIVVKQANREVVALLADDEEDE